MSDSTLVSCVLGAVMLGALPGSIGFATERAGESYSGRYQHIQVSVTEKPAFPMRLLRKGIVNGAATLLLSVDSYGHLEDWMALEATDESIAEAVGEVIYSWDFLPARIDGQATTACQRFPFYIDAEPAYLAMLEEEKRDNPIWHSFFPPEDLSRVRLKPVVAGTVDSLDAFPKLLNREKLRIPRQLCAMAKGGTARFSFYADTEGWVRMPVLESVEGDVPEVALLYVQEALRSLRFAPMTVDGHVATMRFVQEISFDRQDGF